MRLLLLLLSISIATAASSQTIKMSIASIPGVVNEDVLAFQNAVNIPTSSGGGGGTTVGNPVFDAVEFKKVNNTSTNPLFQRSLNGTVIPEVIFYFNDASGLNYYKIVIKDVIISKFSYLSPECNGCTKLYHDVKMVFNKIEVTDVATGNTLKYNLATRTFYS